MATSAMNAESSLVPSSGPSLTQRSRSNEPFDKPSRKDTTYTNLELVKK